MSPTVLLADPAIRVAGLRAPRHRVIRAASGAEPLRARWMLLATLLMLVVAGLGYLRTWPPLATVMSGSMAPTINTGDIVVLKRLDAPARIGDVVMVRVPDEARSRYGYPPVVIHRVAAIAADGMVTTKGDARKDADPFTVPQTALTTRVVAHLPAAGQVLGFFRSTLGLLWLVSGAALFFALPLLERYREAQRRGEAEREARDRALDDALQVAAMAQTQLAEHLVELPAQIERAVASAVAAFEPPAPVVPAVAAVEPPALVVPAVAPPAPVVSAVAAVEPPAPIVAAVAAVVEPPAVAAPAAPSRLVAASSVARIAPVVATRAVPTPAAVAATRTAPVPAPAPPVAAAPRIAAAALTWDALPPAPARPSSRCHGLLCAVGGPTVRT